MVWTKEKKNESNRNYANSERGKEKNNASNRRWTKTPKGIKASIKKLWKKRGLDMDTFYYVYPIYLNSTQCDRCNILLTTGKTAGTQKCMDHCHASGMFRNIVCRNCNMNVIPHIGEPK